MNNNNNNNNKDNNDKVIEYLSWLALVALILAYIILKSDLVDDRSLFCEIAVSVLPELIGSLVVYLVIFYLFIRPGITTEKVIIKELSENRLLIQRLVDSNEELANKVNKLERQSDGALKVYKIVKGQNRKIRDLMAHAARSKPFSNGYYRAVMDLYHKNFSIKKNGFHVDNEYLSLIVFAQFWEYLLKAQKSYKDGENRYGISKNIIARVVHSNSIEIWTNDNDKYREFTDLYLRLQKDFIAAGGTVVRVLIGREATANEEYQKTMKLMDDNGIEVKYLQRKKQRRINNDFVLLYDLELTLQWFSDNFGDTLSGTLINDSIDEKALKLWDSFYEELKAKDDPITSIHDDRQIRIKI